MILNTHMKHFKRLINRGEIVTKNDIIAFFGRLYHLAYRESDQEMIEEVRIVMDKLEPEGFDGALYELVEMYPEAFNN